MMSVMILPKALILLFSVQPETLAVVYPVILCHVKGIATPAYRAHSS